MDTSTKRQGIDCGGGIVAYPNGSYVAASFMRTFAQAGRDINTAESRARKILFDAGCSIACIWNGWFHSSPDMETATFTLDGYAVGPGVRSPAVGMRFGIYHDYRGYMPRWDGKSEDEALIYEITEVRQCPIFACAGGGYSGPVSLRLVKRTTLQAIDRGE